VVSISESLMSKVHSGNHGLHKFKNPRYFIGGGFWFAMVAILIITIWAVTTAYVLFGGH
jgi:hypothetical protein